VASSQLENEIPPSHKDNDVALFGVPGDDLPLEINNNSDIIDEVDQ
jgi:hypothetical protein